MKWLRRIFRKTSAEKQLDSELQFHLEQQIAGHIAAGMSAQEATRRASIEFGGMEGVKEECREARFETHIEIFLRDLRLGLRALNKDRKFSALAILTLALGIGASTIIFSVIYNGVLRPFPYKGANRLTTVGVRDLTNPETTRVVFSLPEVLDFRGKNHVFEDLVGYGDWFARHSVDAGSEQVHGAMVTPNTFEFLGVPPLLGRPITLADGQPGAPPVAVLSYKFWNKQFSGDARAIGATITLEDQPRTVIAVMPPRFQFVGADLWVPIVMSHAPGKMPEMPRPPDPEHPGFLWATGRLKPGITLKAAQADLQVIATQLSHVYTQVYPAKFEVETKTLTSAIVSDFRYLLYALIGAVAMLLLISSSNVANLLLARAISREREMALRASLGASRGRLIRQLLTETLVLASAGCLAGCTLAYAGLKWIVAKLPPRIPAEAHISLDKQVLAFAVGISLLVTLLCGLWPALYASRGDLHMRIGSTGPGTSARGRRMKLRAGLVVIEVALSFALLVCAGLMMRSFYALTHVALGFDPSRVLGAGVGMPPGRYETRDAKRAFFETLFKRIEALPGVISAAETIQQPPYAGPGVEIEIPGQTHKEPWNSLFDPVSEGYFRTIGVRLIHGRLLSQEDIDAVRTVVVVNEAFTNAYLKNEEPLGRAVKLAMLDHLPDTPHGADFQIVGVVSDVRNSDLSRPPVPELYLPYTITGCCNRGLVVRTAVDPTSMVKSVQQEVWAMDRDIMLYEPAALTTMMSKISYAQPEFGLMSFGAFASVGLLLVIAGVFSVTAYTVSLQTHEIGVRMAVGAAPDEILRMVVGRGMRLILAGAAWGVALSSVAATMLQSQLWGVSAADPATVAAVAVILVGVGALACWLPARRATRVDPINALRYE
jgi:putative ABC transport system permease protein